MRAQKLTINAFGPYRDQQIVDFSVLGGESIFLITGPTGAGKTTIFDALCFALYGRASGSDRDQDTMRSHFARPNDPTYVDFRFELRGKEYRVVRMPKQERPKERGEGLREDPARAELYLRTADGKETLLTAKIKEINEAIEDVIGLDYEQFRKMIMIPQGEFRKLISENSKEREEILQRIFKTHFFSDITEHFRSQSKKIEEEIKQYQWKIDQELAKIHWPNEEMEGTDLPPSDIQAKLTEAIDHIKSELLQEKEKYSNLEKQLDARLSHMQKAAKLKDAFDMLTKAKLERKEREQEEDKIHQLEEEVVWIKRAKELVPLEKQLNQREKEYETLSKKQSEYKKLAEEQTKSYKEMEKAYAAEKAKEEERQSKREKWKAKMEELEKLEKVADIKKEISLIKGKKATIEQKIESANKQLERTTHSLQKINEAEHEERSISKLYYDAEKRVDKYAHDIRLVKRLKNEWEELKKLRTQYQQVKAEMSQIEKKVAQQQEYHNKLVEQSSRHQAYQLVSTLEDGRPCPVCGSDHHPAPAAKPDHVPDEEALKQSEKALQQTEAELNNSKQKLIQIKTEGDTKRKGTDTLLQDLRDYDLALEDQSILSGLEELQEKWMNSNEEKQKYKLKLTWLTRQIDQKTKYEEDQKKLQGHCDELQHTLDEVTIHGNKLESRMEALEVDQDKSVDHLQKQIHSLKEEYEQDIARWTRIQEQYMTARDTLNQTQMAYSETRSFTETAKTALDQVKEEFNQTFVQFLFNSENEYVKAKESIHTLDQMQQTIDQHKKEKAILESRIKELSRQVDGETQPDMEQLQDQINVLKREVSVQQELIHHLASQKKQNEQIDEQVRSLLESQGDMAKEYYHLAELAQMCRGDNHLRLSLERYVLTAFLDEILAQANLRFHQMTNHRYELIRSEEIAKRGAQSGLDLEVLDHHTGLQRSVRTLSGGEGFKASLSLALGMVDVVQAHAGGVRLDTLFIDEGFGTLDELSLEQAINCLRGLQDGNRMLGIISHVPQLKEEIPAKLIIETSQKGSSISFSFQ